MAPSFDLDRYFARIGYTGPRAPTLDVLRDVQRLHAHAIPFENLDPLTGRRVSLDLDDVVDKLVVRHRGGYCFEQNRLFAHALMQLGFAVTPLIARVLWGREPGTLSPRTHMLMRVDLDGESWMADVGFGTATLTSPLRLIAGETQPTTLEPFRLSDASHGAFDLEVQRDDAWAKVYRFDLNRVEWIDYEVSNWYTSTYPASFFTTDLVVTRVVPEGRANLFDDRLTLRTKDGRVTERQIGDASELADTLRGLFGIDTADIDIPAVFGRVKGRATRT
ncbi:arylamine N-acetyltransferase family protein [Paraburkholderia saeva]|uniref:Arylamine N-acetyltransferase n=1 Tax=Paraburkholderia saeva TaxID=2777537 RepID=A0A9N8X4N7_9BURK|nr:arylamine N-acetyltransferase [Paraburkholderia saeva]CAG4913056.1 Arylamine N-acetyltransferase [Paraburkholderia saeva]CAG4926931.1 Arylamine N-acetyltransferase [Paraburkholderia saeva]